uniref:NADH-ubiquinone oxidoreductase chain 6 n=1 Tax=Colaspidea globosa TaxID=1425613 RepID=A0A3G1GP89_9CUCU|nr:NADH dehydrogenase subunit 6 [Colaspidea globosa]
MMLMIIMMMSTSLILLNHPMSIGFTLLLSTVMISMMTGTMNSTFWFSYILFLVMIGGMLILFVYMTSIASNEKFKFSMKILMLNLLLMTTMLFLKNHKQSFLLLKLKETKMFNYEKMMNESLKYFTPSLNIIMISSMIYLLIALVMIVKITKKSKGPIRQKF